MRGDLDYQRSASHRSNCLISSIIRRESQINLAFLTGFDDRLGRSSEAEL